MKLALYIASGYAVKIVAQAAFSRSAKLGKYASIQFHQGVLLRFIAVLFFSTAFHAAFLFAPYLGTSAAPAYSSAVSDARGSLGFSIVLARPDSVAAGVPNSPDRGVTPSVTEKNKVETPRLVGEELLPVDGVKYYTSKELSRPAEPLAPISLDSIELGELPTFGTAILKLWIDPTGAVTDVQVVKSEVPDAFVRFATQVFKRSKFAPGQREGVPVGSIMKIEIRYQETLPASKTKPEGAGKP